MENMTEFYLPNAQIFKKYLKDKIVDYNSQHISLWYNDMRYKGYTKPLKYEYYLSSSDFNYLIDIIAAKYNVSNSKDVLPLFFYLYNQDDNYSLNDSFSIMSNFLDNLPESDPIYQNLLNHCREKAKEEFDAVFEYWVEEDDRDDYYDYEEL